jgi:hypothetical protein
MSGMNRPESWNNRFIPTLQVMEFVHAKIRSGFMIEMFAGRMDVKAFAAFVHGVHFHQFCCGQKDEEYMAFIDWLRDVRKEFPSPGGWEERYLADANGDHRVAIMRFLERCAEYRALAIGE